MGGVNKLIQTHYTTFIGANADIGKGFCIAHPFSIMITGGARIGDNVTILQQTTIGGQRGGEHGGAPTIGNNVIICCGAKVLGKVTIGNNVVIGANALVVRDVPDNAVVGGIPAKILNYNGKKHVKYWCRNIGEPYEDITSDSLP